MNRLINRKATGTPKEFAGKLNITEKTLFRSMDYIQRKGISISYDEFNQTYYYTNSNKVEYRCIFSEMKNN